jgi:uncharacterized protein YyaL (SSP411 family)
LQSILSEHEYLIAKEYFHFDKKGYWEDDTYIPLRNENAIVIREKFKLSEEDFNQKILEITNKLFVQRNKRVRPGLDNKIIACWNGLLLKGFSDAFMATNDLQYYQAAVNLAESIIQHLLNENKVAHSIVDAEITNASSQLREGFLDDYASVIEGLIAVYQITFEEKYLALAKNLCTTVIKQFSSEDTPLFYFTSDNAEKLIKRSMELQDNVIPSSNAMMAMNLYILSRYFNEPNYLNRAEQMLVLLQKEINNAIPWYSKWAQVALLMENSKKELVISGPDAKEWAHQIQKNYHPNLIFSIAHQDSILTLNKNRFSQDKTIAFHCIDNACSLPITDLQALSLLFN